MASKKFSPVHPGITLNEDFLKPLGVSGSRLAMDLHVPPSRINDILHGRRGISAESALRIARYFGTSATFWTNLQAQYDLAAAEDESSSIIEREVRPREKLEAASKRPHVRKHTTAA
jgi:addiction module HigA family antidote